MTLKQSITQENKKVMGLKLINANKNQYTNARLYLQKF